MRVNNTAPVNPQQAIKEPKVKGAQSNSDTAFASILSDRIDLTSTPANVAEINGAIDTGVGQPRIADAESAAIEANALKSRILSQPRVALQTQANQAPNTALRLLDITGG